ncbi:MAG: molybdopterin-dependent oxidoreductase, partial [Candidatus Glassbacteria bacterium]
FCVEGWHVNVQWEGFSLAGLLDEAGVDPSANTVIFRAADGYSTSLALAYARSHDLILALQMNGADLPENVGFPLTLVAEGKWGYKWCRWITKVELSADTKFKGYWERYGYSVDGGLELPPM